ncbi:MAG: pseudomonalisin [Candidatus Eremiobacteraeota bacterium]|nr:pseudomonalisin [Candidatus Eremiobacteraeota bacterium]
MTKKLAVLAAAVGMTTASCSGGHGAGSFLPGGSVAPRSAHVADVITAPPGWAATATRGATIPGGTDRGALAPSTAITVRVGLNLHNVDQLANAIATTAKRAPMSPAQFASQYGPTPSEVQSVVAYLQGQGFSNVHADIQLVSADGTAAQVAKAFNTSLEAFSLGGANVYVNTQPAFVPASLGGIVSAVLGLSNAAKMSVRPNLTRVHASCLITAAPTGQCAPAFDAKDVRTFYDVSYVPNGSDTTVAVIAAGDVSGTVADLRYAEAKQGLPQVPVSVVTVGLPSSDTSGAAEWDLDSQSSTGMAENVQTLYFYATTSLSDSDIANAYSKWVTQDVARLGNSSFGECEYSAWLDGAMKVDDDLFMQAAAQGQTMFASSGDTGSSCALAPTNGAPASGPPFVSYPAASPYVVAVGGTTVVANSADASYVGEAAWNAGGGGLSQFENSPAWQRAVIPSSTGLAATNLRGVPDIAMAADAFSGAYNVYGANIPGVGDCSTGCAIGGTSEASPLAMGVYARIMSWNVNMLGYAPRWFYRNYLQYQNSATTVNGPPPTQALGGFHDIITGANGGFTALPGYDYTTGLGTLDVKNMADEIGG